MKESHSYSAEHPTSDSTGLETRHALGAVAWHESSSTYPAGGYDFSNAQVINPVVNHGMAPEVVIAALNPTPENIERARQVDPTVFRVEAEDQTQD